jgi:hypothetical protein
MNGQNHDPFDILFQRAQVDLPDNLKRRLLAIPDVSPAVSFWDVRRILPIITIAPGLFWFLLTHTGAFWQWLGIKLVALASALPVASAVSIPTYAMYFATGLLAVSVITATWLFLRAENRARFSYAKQLTAAG